MSYEKLGFEKGQVLKAEHLNHIEEGISSVSWNDLQDKPFGEVKTVLWQGDYEKLKTLPKAIFDGTPAVKILDWDDDLRGLEGCKYKMYENGWPTNEGGTISVSNFNSDNENYASYQNSIFVVYNSFENNEGTVPSGLWIKDDEWYFIGEIYKERVFVISPDYLPMDAIVTAVKASL